MGCVTDHSFNTADICDIFKTNPKWKSYTEDTKNKWGVPVSLQLSFIKHCLLYTSPSPRDLSTSRMPSSA